MNVMTHGHNRKGIPSPTLQAYRNMINRCYNESTDRYKNYGARGITVCDEWRKGFEFFLRDMGVKPDGLTLERIDVNGNYNKMNCCWKGEFEQRRNTQSTIRVAYKGETMCLADAAKAAGLKYLTVYNRYQRRGNDPSIFQPVVPRGNGKQGHAHNSSTTQVNDIPALEFPKFSLTLPVVSEPATTLQPGCPVAAIAVSSP